MNPRQAYLNTTGTADGYGFILTNTRSHSSPPCSPPPCSTPPRPRRALLAASKRSHSPRTACVYSSVEKPIAHAGFRSLSNLYLISI